MSKSSIFNVALGLIIGVVLIVWAEGFGSLLAFAGYAMIALALMMLFLEIRNPTVKGYKPELSDSELAEIREKRESLGLTKTVKALRIQHRKLGLTEAIEIVKGA